MYGMLGDSKYLNCAVVLRVWDAKALAVDVHELQLEVRDTVLVCDERERKITDARQSVLTVTP